MKWLFSAHWVLVASLWYLGNGTLHDIFVLLRHKGPYSRELLRLLMDGHVLLLSGAVLLVAYAMVLNKIVFGAILGIVIGAFMLLYCAMIFPFLKSMGTVLISLWLIAVCAKLIRDFPDIFNIMQPFK
jgi:hypothetical protein